MSVPAYSAFPSINCMQKMSQNAELGGGWCHRFKGACVPESLTARKSDSYQPSLPTLGFRIRKNKLLLALKHYKLGEEGVSKCYAFLYILPKYKNSFRPGKRSVNLIFPFTNAI